MTEKVIYVLQDAGYPNRVKIGKDSAWPLRFAKAQSHSPRPISCIALWHEKIASSLNAMEKAVRPTAHRVLIDNGKGGTREWFAMTAQQAITFVAAKLDRPPDRLSSGASDPIVADLKPYDDWRDNKRFKATAVRRRLWIGAEFHEDGALGTLKVVHSPYFDTFFLYAPTYAARKFRWFGSWDHRDPVHSDVTNKSVYDLWAQIAREFGQGETDMSVGWLREKDGSPKVKWPLLREFLMTTDLQPTDPTRIKPLDAPPKDPTASGKSIPIGDQPPQHMIHRLW